MARNINELHPRLQNKVKELQALCEKEGLILGIGECFRTVAEQDALYAQGRTTAGSIVTNAKGSSYESQHQWGIAFDFFKNVSGHAYDDIEFFSNVGALAKSIGLAWGGDWTGFVDRPHLYLPDWGSTTSKLKSQYGTVEAFQKTWDSSSAPDSAPDPKAEEEVIFSYRVKAGGKWYAIVKNLSDYAGVIGKAITDVAIGVNIGSVKYRVHVLGGDWLPWVTGFNINDYINGYAGNGKVIDAIEIYYFTPDDYANKHGYKKAQYRVSPLKANYYDWQYDNEITNGQDGYAGAFGKAIDRFQLW